MLLERYAAGVNAFIARGRLPIEFTVLGYTPAPWAPTDTLLWGKLLSLNMTDDYGLDLLRTQVVVRYGLARASEIMLVPDRDNDALQELDAFAAMKATSITDFQGLAGQVKRPDLGQGSNSWVIGGDRTASGKPILAADSHLRIEMPILWYMNSLEGGDIHSSGFSLPGVPLVLMGHNQRITWAPTNLARDVQQLYIERLDDPANPQRYEFQGGWRDLESVEEQIEVKGQDPVALTVRRTHHGPIINDVETGLRDAPPVSMSWPDFDPNTLFQGVVGINQAGNWQEFRAALRHWGAPRQNFVYADIDGNIGYQAAGNLPRVPEGHFGTLPVPGWTGEYDWQGYLPFEDLPTLYNPPEGYIVAANSQVQPSDRGASATEYFYVSSYRTDTIVKLIQDDARIDTDDIRRMQAGTTSLHAQTLAPYLAALAPQDDVQRQVLDALADWNYTYEIDSIAPTIYETWYWFLQKNILRDELGEELMVTYVDYNLATSQSLITLMADPQNAWFDRVDTPEIETRDQIVQKSLADALDWLKQNHGDDPAGWTWGKLHSLTFAHQPFGRLGIGAVDAIFNGGTIPARGGDFTINNAWYDPSAPFSVAGGTTQRFIADLGSLSSSLGILATGESAHIFHPHRTDMVERWQKVEYLQMRTARDTLPTDTTLRLTP